MYFKNFPTIYYGFEINGKTEVKTIVDITRNVRVLKSLLSNITLYDLYDIRDGETPEMISYKFYNTPMYHWVIMLINDKYDYISDFPLSEVNLVEFIKEKYGEDNVYATHHYETDKGLVVDSDHPGAVEITNYQYESKQNEKKRRIKIISNEFMSAIIKQFNEIIK